MLDRSRCEPIESPRLAAATVHTSIKHGFFTRNGGVSEGLYASLNVGLGSGDETASVTTNRKRVCAWFATPADRLTTVHQVHSAHAVIVERPFDGERPRADALVTDRPGLVIGVLTADCGPILMADAQAGVVAAAHAGWRGAFGGIVESTVAAMERLGAARRRITACLGPSISGANYEVGPEFIARFVEGNAGYRRFFTPARRPDHFLFDLPAFTLMQLGEAGVEAETLDLCTYADAGRFFSYRRATHRDEPDYGRQISAISMTEQ